jgi:antirestriction protein ArdC
MFGSDHYSREELVAELASAFTCAAIGLDNSLLENSASYLDGWLTALKADPKALVIASAQAQRAADFIRREGGEEQPSSSSEPPEASA